MQWLPIGLAAAGANVLYMVYVVMVYILKDEIMEGWTTLSLQSSGQFLFITLILAAVSEYVGRSFGRLRGRPLYYVMDEKESAVLLVEHDRVNVVSEPGNIHEITGSGAR